MPNGPFVSSIEEVRECDDWYDKFDEFIADDCCQPVTVTVMVLVPALGDG